MDFDYIVSSNVTGLHEQRSKYETMSVDYL